MSGTVSVPAVGFVMASNSAIRVDLRGQLGKRASLVFAISPFPRLFVVNFFAARRPLIVERSSAIPPPIGPMPLVLCIYQGAVWKRVSDDSGVAAPHDDIAVCDWVGVETTRRTVEKHGAYHVPNIPSPKSCFLYLASPPSRTLQGEPAEWCPRSPRRIVCPISSRSSSVQNKNEVVGIVVGLHFHVNELLMARPSILLSLTVVLLARTSQLACASPAPFFTFLLSNLFTILLAESDVVRNRTLQRSWYACFHVSAQQRHLMSPWYRS